MDCNLYYGMDKVLISLNPEPLKEKGRKNLADYEIVIFVVI